MSEQQPDSTAKKTLEGRVAQILNERELVINIGADKGVSLGMKFAVLVETPTEVRDPITSELLDVLDREKVRVEASEVRPRVTVCKTYKVLRTRGGPLYGSFGSLYDAPREATETLRAKDSSLPRPLAPEESYVKINDRVIQIADDD